MWKSTPPFLQSCYKRTFMALCTRQRRKQKSSRLNELTLSRERTRPLNNHCAASGADFLRYKIRVEIGAKSVRLFIVIALWSK